MFIVAYTVNSVLQPHTGGTPVVGLHYFMVDVSMPSALLSLSPPLSSKPAAGRNLLMKVGPLPSSPPPLPCHLCRCLHIADMSQGLKSWVWMQRLSQCLPNVSVSVCPTTSLHLTLNQWWSVSNSSNNPAGLTSLCCTVRCIRKNISINTWGDLSPFHFDR